jgi:hypothetical protein
MLGQTTLLRSSARRLQVNDMPTPRRLKVGDRNGECRGRLRGDWDDPAFRAH